MPDLVSRLSETLDELERVPNAGHGTAMPEGWRGQAGQWTSYLEGGDDGWAVESADGSIAFVVGDETIARHIARWDPQAVLRLVAAHREIIEVCRRLQDAYESRWAMSTAPPLEPTDHFASRMSYLSVVMRLAKALGITEEEG